MSVKIENYEAYGKTNKVIVVDKSDTKHSYRTFRIFKELDVLNRIIFSMKVDWTPEEYHPTMVLDEDDIKNLIQKLQELLD